MSEHSEDSEQRMDDPEGDPAEVENVTSTPLPAVIPATAFTDALVLLRMASKPAATARHVSKIRAATAAMIKATAAFEAREAEQLAVCKAMKDEADEYAATVRAVADKRNQDSGRREGQVEVREERIAARERAWAKFGDPPETFPGGMTRDAESPMAIAARITATRAQAEPSDELHAGDSHHENVRTDPSGIEFPPSTTLTRSSERPARRIPRRSMEA
jgi:hypothetical protein